MSEVIITGSKSADELKHMTVLADAALTRVETGQRGNENRLNRWLGISAIVVATASALFTAWQGYEARQSRLAFMQQAAEAREDAREAAKNARQDAQDAIRIQVEQNRRATELAQHSADAAIESNRLSSQALAASQAANLSVQFFLTSPLAVGKSIDVTATLWNRGNVTTETKVVLGLLDATFIRSNQDTPIRVLVSDSLRFEEPPDNLGLNSFLIPMKGPLNLLLPSGVMTTQSVATPPALDESEIAAIASGRIKIHALAFLEYKDGFGKIKREGFCGVYEGRGFGVCNDFRFRFDRKAFQPSSMF